MLFTIVTVCFNSVGTIRKTFDSILEQDFDDYEYIVVDGASTDGTVELIKEYEPKFNGRMRYLSEKDNGIYDAMNKALKMANGDFVNFMNSDDYFEANALSNTAKWIGEHPCAGVYYGFSRFLNSDGQEFCITRKNHNALSSCKHMINHQAIFMRRDLFEKYGNFSTQYRIVADNVLLLKVYKGGEVFSPMPHLIVNYRNDGLSSNQKNWKKLRDERLQMKVELGFADAKATEQMLHEERVCMKVNSIVSRLLYIGRRIFGIFK